MISLTPGIDAAVSADAVWFCRLIKIEMDTPIYITDYYKDIQFDGNIYDSTPHLISVGDIKQAGLRRNSRTSITLSGVDQTYYSLFLNDDYTNRKVTVMFAFFDENDELIEDPMVLTFGLILEVGMSDDPGKGDAEVKLSVGSPFDDFKRKSGRQTSGQSQAVLFPDDKGFEFVAQAADVEKGWGDGLRK